MIKADDDEYTIRIQNKSKNYLKLNDGGETFMFFYDPTPLSQFVTVGFSQMVEWDDK